MDLPNGSFGYLPHHDDKTLINFIYRIGGLEINHICVNAIKYRKACSLVGAVPFELGRREVSDDIAPAVEDPTTFNQAILKDNFKGVVNVISVGCEYVWNIDDCWFGHTRGFLNLDGMQDAATIRIGFGLHHILGVVDPLVENPNGVELTKWYCFADI